LVAITEQQLRRLLENFHGKRIAVVGDLMIDRYYWGSVHRVSPEAPVPVVEVESESIRLGGAANVANNILALGGTPLLCGLIGDDHGGSLFRDLLRGQNLDSAAVIVDPARPTTIKTRVIAAGQHVVRIDNELKQECPQTLEAKLIGELRARIGTLDGIIIEDYNKGAVTRGVIRAVIEAANARGIPVTVDPKLNNFFEFTEVTVFKPNRREVEEALGGRLRTPSEIEGAGRRLLETLRARNVLLTRGEEGMSLFESDGTVTHYPTTAEVVQDVSGAGDTVISTLTMALVSGASVREACALANCAGGVVVGAVGIVPVRPEQLQEAAARSLHARRDGH